MYIALIIITGILLLAALVAYAGFRFKEVVASERKKLIARVKWGNPAPVTNASVAGLPPVVQRWLNSSGAIGKSPVSTVYLTQELKLKLQRSQTDWSSGTADQIFTVHPPAFNWRISMKMNPLLKVAGRDTFEEGKGEMTIKLLSLIPIAHAGNNDQVNQATLQRFLAEIVWFPSAALSPYIRWEQLDGSTAKATMEYNESKGSGIFSFGGNGQFRRFTAMRYKDVGDAAPTEWVVKATATEERNGIKIPTACEASWKLDTGHWTWLKLKIRQIEYDVRSLPLAEKR